MQSSPHPAAGAWVDLIGLTGSERVLFAGLDPDDSAVDRVRFRALDVTTTSVEGMTGALGQKPWDIVVGHHLGFDAAVTAASTFRDAGAIVLVADNRLSPLAGKRQRARGWTPRQLSTLLSSLGDSTFTYALLRSADIPTSSFRLDLPELAEVVLEGAAVGAGPARKTAIRTLARLARFGLARYVVPSWLVVRSDRNDLPTGRMGVAENDQGVVLYGRGPASVEKRYDTAEEVEAVHRAMTSLGAAGVDVGGRVLGQPSALRLRLEWVHGDVLDANALSAEELGFWTERASEILGRIHLATLEDDGSVLVHGDFWLGAVVTVEESIAGVIDWTDSHRGSPTEDLETLLQVPRSRRDLTDCEREAVLVSARRGYRTGGGDPTF